MILMLSSCASTEMKTLIEKDKVRTTIDKMYIATDERDWEQITNLFSPQVEFDMSSLSGQKMTVETGKAISDMWKQGLSSIPVVHHQSGNYLIEINGDQATVFNYGMATHHFPKDKKLRTRWFVGNYNWKLKKIDNQWKITAIKFNKKYVDDVAP